MICKIHTTTKRECIKIFIRSYYFLLPMAIFPYTSSASLRRFVSLFVFRQIWMLVSALKSKSFEVPINKIYSILNVQSCSNSTNIKHTHKNEEKNNLSVFGLAIKTIFSFLFLFVALFPFFMGLFFILFFFVLFYCIFSSRYNRTFNCFGKKRMLKKRIYLMGPLRQL